jgi:two-component system sensor histidine kinase KdpD
MTEPRPSPDELLALTAAASARGRLRVYLGMCPGVGKTYAMLEEATRRPSGEGAALVGVVETHGRAETKALAERLPALPRLAVEHRGARLDEFDLDEALRRRPALLLVDELAHTNIPGARHPKRWQDVEELLAAGVSVWTTLNIQHVESLRDEVAAITGVRVRETVPDAFLDQADEIRVIDLTPDQLRARLAEGKVYLGERAGAAADGFFREGNLRALREMALRFAARQVDAEKRDFMRRNLIAGPWRAGERFLVAVGPSPHAERLVRLTARLARSHNAGWLAAHIEAGPPPGEAGRSRLAANLSLARALGGETVSHPCEDPVRGILEVARRENVTQIVAGKNIRSGWWSRLRGSVADRLQAESGKIDLLLVHPGEASDAAEGGGAAREDDVMPEIARQAWFRDAGVVLGALATATLLGFGIEPWLGYRSVALLYLVAVPLAGLVLTRGGVVALALLGGFTWNFFFTAPRLNFHMAERADFTQLAAMLAVAVVIGQLTHRLRLREQSSRASEERARALYQLTRVTSASTSLEQGVRAALTQVEALFRGRASLLIAGADGEPKLIGGAALSDKRLSVCRWAIEHRRPAGRFTDTLPESEVFALPLAINASQRAVLAILPFDEGLASPVARDLLETFGAHLGVLVEREEHFRARQDAELLERSRGFQRALLDHVAHEIKTPVAVIRGSVDHLATGAAQPALLAEIREAAERLNRVMTQLLALSRAEAGLVRPTYEVCDARDLMQEIAERLPADRVVVSCPADLRFRSDPAVLDAVLFNLVKNGVDHGEGPVDFSAEATAEGGERTQGERVVFRVRNAGAPIPAEAAGRIFERFARIDATRAGGLGLGLPIARSFAQLLGGTVELRGSDVGGTVFEAVFPLTGPVDKQP